MDTLSHLLGCMALLCDPLSRAQDVAGWMSVAVALRDAGASGLSLWVIRQQFGRWRI